MSDKIFNARVQLKRDTSANWALATNFSPKLGEPVYYTDLNKIKIGDGTTNVNSLPFLDPGIKIVDLRSVNNSV